MADEWADERAKELALGEKKIYSSERASEFYFPPSIYMRVISVSIGNKAAFPKNGEKAVQ